MIVSGHAVERYVERAKPHLGREQARLELEALVELGEAVERPEWLLGDEFGEHVFLEVAPDVVAIVQRERVATVIAKPVDELERRRKNVAKANRRRAKRLRRSSRGLAVRHDHRPAPDQDWAA